MGWNDTYLLIEGICEKQHAFLSFAKFHPLMICIILL